MNLSRQKIDIYDKIDRINAQISILKQKVAILRNGAEAVENGEDMFNGSGILAISVRQIMKVDDEL